MCDAIAYNNHDVDDGYRAGLISLEQLREQPLFDTQYREVARRYPGLEDRRLIYEIIRRMINAVVTDLIETTKHNLDEAAPESIDEVRAAGRPLVGFSAEIGEQHRLLKQFLHSHLYSHEQKLEMTRKVQTVLRDLFETFMNDVNRMPSEFAAAAADGDDTARARVVADYIAGMTDRYAFAEHSRISG
jgi:dGTPase